MESSLARLYVVLLSGISANALHLICDKVSVPVQIVFNTSV